jgi:hypothetical protein
MGKLDYRRTAAAERQRVARARRRAGEAVFKVTANHVDVLDALVKSGRMTEDATLRQRQVESALGEILRDWVGALEINRHV